MDRPTQHIFLTPENTLKVQAIRNSLNRSAGDIVNSLLEQIETLELEEIVKLTIRKPNGSTRIVSKRRRWTVRL